MPDLTHLGFRTPTNFDIDDEETYDSFSHGTAAVISESTPEPSPAEREHLADRFFPFVPLARDIAIVAWVAVSMWRRR
jgi:hypothetical protein